ncbi:amidohydrolase family protein [Paraburkholderia agricolaris]|uniref:amidohydrolase family protein n=1 Tax=Paraburkholderia agricolaris TaxID=2152888 RepID=UPI00129258C0|nr:amidohydrolase family protein [Paraburkholderia agricolaris]
MNSRDTERVDSLYIVDAHHHLWDLQSGHYPWLQDEYLGAGFFLGEYDKLRQNYFDDAYRRDTAHYRVVATVHIEAERSRTQQVDETRWLHDLGARTGLPSVIVPHVCFTQPDLDAVLAAHVRFPAVRGIRSKPVTAADPHSEVAGQPGTLQDPAWLDGLAHLEGYGLSWDLRVPFWHLCEAAEVAKLFPGLAIVLNHTGLPLDRSEEGLSIWRKGLAALADAPNVFIKLSELGLRGGQWDPISNRRVLRDAVSIFGAKRAIFASNLPVSGLSASFEQIVDGVLDAVADLGDEAVQDIFANNARRFYRMNDTFPKHEQL